MANKLQLLSPLQIGDLTLKNRVVMAPLTRGRCWPSRMPSSHNAQYYAQRASAGLIITEATAISDQGYGWFGSPGIYTEEQAKSWKTVVDAVHAKGSKIFLQLWHMGRQAHSSFHETKEIVSASAIGITSGHARDANNEVVPYEVPRALRTDEIPGIVEDYRKAAELAKSAGFDGVEIHAANGYLIDQFLQSCTNKRTDKYGGSVENRVRFALEVIEAILTVYPSNRIGIRISPNGNYGGMGSSDNDQLFSYFAEQLSKYNLAYLHIMDGLAFGHHGLCKPITLFDVKSKFKGPVMGNISYTKEVAEGAIRSGSADLIAFGRPYLSNPDLVERFENDWPLNPSPGYDTWYYRPNPEEFYSDYPYYEPSPSSSS